MADDLLLALAGLCCACGMAWLALAMKPHWKQVRGRAAEQPSPARALRFGGAAALCASLVLCFAADHPTMAAINWVMLVSAATVMVALTLAFRPRWLAWLVVWVPTAPR